MPLSEQQKKARDKQLADRVKAIYSKRMEPKVLKLVEEPLNLQHQERSYNPLPQANVNAVTDQGRRKVTESSSIFERAKHYVH